MASFQYTIVPFGDQNKLPACAKGCGPLYDVNGACNPPQTTGGPSVYDACFCKDSRVAMYSTGIAGPCDAACGSDQAAMSSIAGWFQSLCHVKGVQTPKTQTGSSTTTATAGSDGSDDGASTGSSAKSGDWFSNHWQWVVMLIILVIGIAGIWVGACIWRRRYLRRKDRQTSLGQKHSGSARNPSWGPAVTGSNSATPMTAGAGGDTERGIVTEKSPSKPKNKKKWTVKQRT